MPWIENKRISIPGQVEVLAAKIHSYAGPVPFDQLKSEEVKDKYRHVAKMLLGDGLINVDAPLFGGPAAGPREDDIPF